MIVVIDPLGDPRADVVEADEQILVETFVAHGSNRRKTSLFPSIRIGLRRFRRSAVCGESLTVASAFGVAGAT